MGYMHIQNLYADQSVLLTGPEVYVLEKIHGTSAHVAWRAAPAQLHLHHGGGSAAVFGALFDAEALRSFFKTHYPRNDVTIYGEFYGGSILRMSNTYGTAGKFIAFDVQVSDVWVDVPGMAFVAAEAGIEVVDWKRVPATLDALDAERDAPSVQAARNGIGTDKKREGIVIRPFVEQVNRFGARIMAKHKGPDFSETATPRPVVDMSKVQEITDAAAIAEEWVVPNRLDHVLQRFPGETLTTRDTKRVIDAMIEDVRREGIGFEWSTAVGAAVAKRTAFLFVRWVGQRMGEGSQ